MKEDFYEQTVQFFDEMNIIRTEKAKRVETANIMRGFVESFFNEVYKDLQRGVFLHEKTDNDYLTELITLYEIFVEKVDKGIALDSDIIAKSKQFADFIHNTNKKVVMSASDKLFWDSILLGVPIKEKDIPQSVRKRFTQGQSATDIGINESLFIHNYINHKEYVDAGRVTHTWLTQEDERVRTPHAEADGQTVPIDKPFIIGGYKMMFPGDTLTDDAPGELVINCRCLEI